jgi:UDP-N-acetylmuramyl pentapeptide phosphotransferase/UDP-N-acetylglucosamine-1-phosphate transferase
MHPAKIFMGDTGAMAVGFILGFLSLQFLVLNIGLEGQAWHIPNAHVFAVAVLIIPIKDTLSVIFLRLVKGKSPFAADRNHIHHKLTDTGINDLYVSFFLWLANIFVIGIAYSVMHLEINVQLSIIILLGVSIFPVIRYTYVASQRLFLADDKNQKGKSGNAAYDVN